MLLKTKHLKLFKNLSKSRMKNSLSISLMNSDNIIMNEDNIDNKLLYGVSLAYLAQLPIPYEEGFWAAAEYVKAKTHHQEATSCSQSYAQWLKSNPNTQHLVRDQATVFVSFAWSGGFGNTMEALTTHFGNQLEETFVWMDFAIVDQHNSVSNTSTRDDVTEWANVLGKILARIGKAVLVLTPIRNPLAITRSWCCLELTTMIRTNTPFIYCVPCEDERDVINFMRGGMSLDDFYTVFSNVNVENASASKHSDQQAIMNLIKQDVGVIVVNDVVLKGLKEWFVMIAKKAEGSATWATMEMTRILNSRAALHLAMGEFEQAFSFYERALDCAKSIPNNETEIAIQLSNFAGLLREQGEYEAAESLDRESLEVSKRVLGENHPDVAASMNNLAVSLINKGDFEAAEPLLIEALRIRRHVLGQHPEELAESLHNLAGLLEDKGEYERAEPLYRESLAIYKQCLGEDHSTVATSMNNLALLLMNRKCEGYEAEAESLLRRSLSVRRRVLGEEHPDVASSLNNLAGLMKQKGEKKEAEELFQQSLIIKRKVYDGDQHPSVANTMHHLATLMKERGDVQTAEKYYRDSLAIRKQFLGENHHLVASSLHNLAKLVFEDKHELVEAEKLFREALSIFKSSFGQNHPSVASTSHCLAKLLEEDNRLTEASSLGLEAYLFALERFGPTHPDTIRYEYWKKKRS